MIRHESVIDLLKELNATDESEDLEAKEVSGDGAGKSVYETICAFANEPDLGGGTILLGVDSEQALFALYSVCGVKNPDKLSSDISSACATMFNQPIRVDIKPVSVNGLIVLKIDVPELPKSQKPLYFKATGLPKGAFRRIGPTDLKCTDEDLLAFFHGKANDPYDARIVPDAGWDDLDPVAIAAYRKHRSEANKLAEELAWSDDDMLFSIGAIRHLDNKTKITITGILIFGKSLSIRRIFPTHRVDYIRVPSSTWFSGPESLYESLDMRGSIMTLVPRVMSTILDDIPRTFDIKDGMSGQRTEIPVVPSRVIREAVVNALMHRSYQSFKPVQIIRYTNRIEIKNPGYSLKSQDRFDEPGSYIRNPTIAEILHETRFAETKGSGIRIMQAKMKEHGLAAPTFESDRDNDEFTATLLFHHFLDDADLGWLSKFGEFELSEDQMKALVFVREVGAINNSTYRSLTYTDTLSASRNLRTLVEKGLLDGQGAGSRAHYVAGPEMLLRSSSKPIPEQKDARSSHDKSAVLEDFHDSDVSFDEIPAIVRSAVRAAAAKKRLTVSEAQNAIQSLCAWRPLSLAEIAKLIKRTPTYTSQRFVSQMVADGRLCYLFPEIVQHPGQKYVAQATTKKAKKKDDNAF